MYVTWEWWSLDLSEFQYQIDWACRKCGCQIPLKSKRSILEKDDISPSNLNRLKFTNSPKIQKNKYIETIGQIDKTAIRDGTFYWRGE